jgi:hypothetical protein
MDKLQLLEPLARSEANDTCLNQKVFAETGFAANEPNARAIEDTFDKNRQCSLNLVDQGLLPSIQVGEKSVTNNDTDQGPLTDDAFNEMQQGMTDAKAKTKGWDSASPPTVDQLKERIGENNVVFWGDVHPDKNSPERFKNALDPLKKSGVDTVAMEGLREDQQQSINDWLAAESGSAQEKRLELEISTYLSKSLNGKMIETKIMELLKGIKAAGMNVLCIEPKGAAMTNTGDGEPQVRDGNWNKVVQNHLQQNPDSKVLIFAGSGHFIHMRDETIRDIMHNNGTPTTDLTPPSQYQ